MRICDAAARYDRQRGSATKQNESEVEAKSNPAVVGLLVDVTSVYKLQLQGSSTAALAILSR